MAESDRLKRFLIALLPLLREHGARTAYVFGSHARGTADEHSDIDVIIVAQSDRACVDRFQDYLPAILEVGGRVDLFVYTPEEFEAMRSQERPFLIHALDGAKVVYEG
jgi:predicted nucleotidyltransferase